MELGRCKDCQYKNRPRDKFPCDKCKEKGFVPLTCDCCRCYPCNNKKGIRPCKNFEWD